MSHPITLFHLSDIHFGLENPEAVAWVEGLIAQEQPSAVVISGDLTMRARTHEFAAAANWIGKLDVPVALVPGNHDIPGYHLPERYLAPLTRFESFRLDCEQPLRFANLAVVPLNTNVPAQWRLNWSKGRVTKAALAHTLRAIDALPAATRVLVMAHHPLREAGTHGTALTSGGAAALDALAKRNVLGVLSGHVHDAFDIIEPTPHGMVRMIGAGTLSHRIRTTPASFNELTWDGETLTVRVRDMGGFGTRALQIDEVPEDAEPPMGA